MRFGSVCAGIEAASVAWHPLGWKAAWLSEIEPFAAAVLAHHYPNVKNLGDMTAIAKMVITNQVEAPDVLCGGTPCQGFSVAGLRQSLADERGNLSLKFVELADAIDHVRIIRGQHPSIVFWENVPGVLSTKDNAFGCFLAGLAGEDEPIQPPGGRWSNAGAVYGPTRSVAWRTLDAQYFGLAQRRRRVFVVASARNDFDPAKVLFEWQSLRRDSAPSREAREATAQRAGAGAAFGGMSPVAGTLTANTGGMTRPAGNANELDFCVPVHAPEIARCIATREGSSQDWESTTMVAQPMPINTMVALRHESLGEGTGFGIGESGDPAYTLTKGHSHAVAQPMIVHGTQDPCVSDVAFAQGRNNDGENVLQTDMVVRRLTPKECERLQGFPDDYTAIPWRTAQEAKRKGVSYESLLSQRGMTLRGPSVEECPDGPRYKALGNSWAVPVVRWIGSRIQEQVNAP